ncbi:hypothetical protein KAW48_03965 [candidate division WOR-3 bacterium]|nr:hypothetical protein [candidate division WOR-3 bacterium]
MIKISEIWPMIWAPIFIGFIVMIISLIKWVIGKIQGKKWKDIKPTGNPLTQTGLKKAGKEDNIYWLGEKESGRDYWSFFISDDKDLAFDYNLYRFHSTNQLFWIDHIQSWEDLINARDKMIYQIKRLEPNEKWEYTILPETIKNCLVKFRTGGEEKDIKWFTSGTIKEWGLPRISDGLGGDWDLQIYDLSLPPSNYKFLIFDAKHMESWFAIKNIKDNLINQIVGSRNIISWFNKEPPENVMRNKYIKKRGKDGNSEWEIWKESNEWHINMIRKGIISKSYRDVANSWDEIIHKKDKILKQ